MKKVPVQFKIEYVTIINNVKNGIYNNNKKQLKKDLLYLEKMLVNTYKLSDIQNIDYELIYVLI
jgi:hypothetical protein